MTEAVLIDEIKVGNTLGECVLRDNRRRSLWWTDIVERILFEYRVAERKRQLWKALRCVGSFRLVNDERRLIAGFDRGVGLSDLNTGTIDWLTPNDFVPSWIRLNDGKLAAMLNMPVSRLTCVAFGGHEPNHRFISITSAGISPDRFRDEPSAGISFNFSTDVTGLPESRFQWPGSD